MVTPLLNNEVPATINDAGSHIQVSEDERSLSQPRELLCVHVTVCDALTERELRRGRVVLCTSRAVLPL